MATILAWVRSPVGRRVTGIVAVIAGALLVGHLFSQSPVEVDVAFRFDTERRSIRAMRVEYPGAHTVSFVFDANGAPAEKIHRTHLPAGVGNVTLRISTADGQSHAAETSVDVPSTGGRVFVDVR